MQRRNYVSQNGLAFVAPASDSPPPSLPCTPVSRVLMSTSIETRTHPKFQQSQSYLFFWDKFEKCNYFLENVLLTVDRPLDGRLVQHLLKEPICDGGKLKLVAHA